ncbi:MAG: HPr family phosphocarrier protein [Lachnospiraceae bacterium]|nr:HPr family phosphocarrier protein [Lachnospiraceae bacterium]
MITRRVVVTEPLGLHLRPAGVFCEESLKYESKIQIRKGTSLLNAKSVLGVLAARVQCGDEVELICDGPDEEEAITRLAEILTGDKYN